MIRTVAAHCLVLAVGLAIIGIELVERKIRRAA
jgi:hypothetical protein